MTESIIRLCDENLPLGKHADRSVEDLTNMLMASDGNSDLNEDCHKNDIDGVWVSRSGMKV